MSEPTVGRKSRLLGPRRQRRKPRREDLPPQESPCNYCVAKCCRYFALPIDKPDSWKEFDYLRWFLLHGRTAVFVEDGNWYVLLQSRCRHLRADNKCACYADRPLICREYTVRNCEYEDDWVYEQYWETPEQVEEYAEAVLGPRRGRGFHGPKPRR